MTATKTEAPSVTEHTTINEQAALPPKISTTVSLGIYERSMPEPEFDIDYAPAETHDNVRAMVVKVPDGNEYRLQCIFQNFSNHLYTATIKEKHA